MAVGISVAVGVGEGVDVGVDEGVGVDVGVEVGVEVGVGVPVGVRVGVGVWVSIVALGEGVGTTAISPGVGVPVRAGAKVAGRTTTAVPAGVRMRLGSQEGGVITSGRSGSIRPSPVPKASSGFNSENILAETFHARSGVTANCAVIMRQAKPSSSIRRNTSRPRHSRLLSRSPLESFGATSPSVCRDISVRAFPAALVVLQRWKNHAECTADSFFAEDLNAPSVCLDNRSSHV